MSSITVEFSETVQRNRFAPRGDLFTTMTLTENSDGTISVSLSVSGTNDFTGDLRAFFFDVPDDALLPGLSVTGQHVTETQFAADRVYNMGWGAHLSTTVARNYGLFDAGVEVGTWGQWENDIKETSFVISHETQALTLDMFAGQNLSAIVGSVGQEGSLMRWDSVNVVTTLGYAPDAADDVFETDAGERLSGNVLANDTDADSMRLVVEAIDGGRVGRWFEVETAGGRVVEVRIARNGSFEIRGFEGFENLLTGDTDSIAVRYTVFDLDAGRDTAELRVTINGTVSGDINEAPVASSLDLVIDEDTVLEGQLVATDADGDALTFSLVSGPSNGTVTINANGTFAYTPGLDYNGADSFSYLVDDGNGGTDMETVSIDVNPVNDAPTVVDDVLVVDGDARRGNGNLLGNDFDVDSRRILVENIEGGQVNRWFQAETEEGHDVMVRVRSNGLVNVRFGAREFNDLYEGDADTLSLTYTVSDRDGGTSDGELTIVINGVVPPPAGNEAPVADDMAVAVDEDNVFGGQLGATDSDGDSLSYILASETANGAVALSADGSFTYTPDTNFHGSDTFTYTVSDGNGGTDTGTVTISVAAVNDAPVARDASLDMAEDAVLNGSVMADDVDGDSLVFALDTDAVNGTVTINDDGTFTYTPDTNFFGMDSFIYGVSDGNGGADTGAVTVTVTGGNDAPVTQESAFEVAEDAALDGALSATDDEGDALSFTLDTSVLNGTLVLNGDGSFTYTPYENFHGSDIFTYTVSDGNGVDTGTATISVLSVNDNPVAQSGTYATDEDTALNGSLTAADVDGDGLIFALDSDAANGAVTVNADGTFTYTPDANFFGPDGFTYSVSDGNGGFDTATVTVDVAPVNDPPSMMGGHMSVDENSVAGTVVGAVSAVDVDDGVSGLSYRIVGGSGGGLFEIDSVGTVTVAAGAVLDYETATGYDLNIQVTDGEGLTGTGLAFISIADVNEGPVAFAGHEVIDQDSTVSGQLSASDPDVGDVLSYTLLDAPAHGAVTVNTDGTFIYVPEAGYEGSDVFAFQVQDSGGLVDSAGVQIDVQYTGPGTFGGVENEETAVSANSSILALSAPEVCRLGDGGHLVVWGTYYAPNDNSYYGVVAQRYDETGAKFGGTFRVNGAAIGEQTYPTAAGLVDGGFVIVWQSDQQGNEGIYGRVYYPDNTQTDEFLITATTGGDEMEPTVAALDNGGFVVSWTGQQPGETTDDVFVRTFTRDPVTGAFTPGDEIVANVAHTFGDQETYGYQTETVANIGDGRFVVVWTEGWESDGRGPSVMARIFNEDGTPAAGSETEFRVNTTTGSFERMASVGTLENGNFIVVWDAGHEGTPGIYAKIYTPDGVPVVGDHTLDGQFRIDGGAFSAEAAKVQGLPDGSFFAVWEYWSGGINYDIYGRHFAADGQPAGDEFRINSTYLRGGQIDVSLDVTDDGSVVIVWRDDYNGGIWQKILEFDDGGISPKNITGTEADDILFGGNLDDTLRGEGGEDVLYGEAGSDSLYGGSGADTFMFLASNAFEGVDTVADFEAGLDALDVSDMLFGYDPLVDAINDFVSVTTDGIDTIVAVDLDGAGATYVGQDIAVLENVTGLGDAQAMLDNSELIVVTGASVV